MYKTSIQISLQRKYPQNFNMIYSLFAIPIITFYKCLQLFCCWIFLANSSANQNPNSSKRGVSICRPTQLTPLDEVMSSSSRVRLSLAPPHRAMRYHLALAWCGHPRRIANLCMHIGSKHYCVLGGFSASDGVMQCVYSRDGDGG